MAVGPGPHHQIFLRISGNWERRKTDERKTDKTAGAWWSTCIGPRVEIFLRISGNEKMREIVVGSRMQLVTWCSRRSRPDVEATVPGDESRLVRGWRGTVVSDVVVDPGGMSFKWRLVVFDVGGMSWIEVKTMSPAK